MKPLLSILLLIPAFLIGQTKISGLVKEGKQAVAYATVYINGSTYGTITNTRGYFEIEAQNIPCQLIVSHLSYKPQSININSKSPKELSIELTPQKINLLEVKIEDRNHWSENLAQFKDVFLGADYWGINAKLENEEVLTFNYTYYSRKINITDNNKVKIVNAFKDNLIKWSADSTYILVKSKSSFEVSASEPLIVDLPLLGYKVHINLVAFNVFYEPNYMTGFLGYYYFKPYENVSNRENQKYIRKRKEAYYNSSQHFCRSLFANELEQNGYELIEKIRTDTLSDKLDDNVVDSLTSKRIWNNKGKYTLRYLDETLPMNSISVHEKQILGLKDKNYIIMYFHNSNGTPRNLNTQKRWSIYKQSNIHFGSDTCIIRQNGIIPNNMILFGGSISNKQVGALLPDDYQPEADK